MLLHFLRLFAAFRTLEQDRDATVANLCETLQQMTTEKLLLQDRLDSQIESVAHLWGMVESAQARAYQAMEMQVNFATQQRFGVTTYPDAAHLPPSAEPSAENASPFGRRLMPSEMVAKRTADFLKEFQKRHQKPA